MDENKRRGLVIALLFFAYNGITLNATDHELYEIIMLIAQSKISGKESALFFKNKALPASAERSMQ